MRYYEESDNMADGREMVPDRTYGNQWHLDRGIPIALLATIGGAGASAVIAGIWFAAVITTDVNNLKAQMVLMTSLNERVIRLEGKIDGIMTEIKSVIRPPSDRR